MHSISRTIPFALLLLMTGVTSAQTPSTTQKAACKINTAPATPGDLAYFRGETKKAQELFASQIAANPADSRSREHEIDILLSQKKLDEANKKLDAWVSASPKDAYAIVAASDIHFDEGNLPEAYAMALKSLSIDPCNADAYVNAAHFESLAGYHATARKHYALAHQLLPSDEDIRLDWINSLDRAQFLDEMKKYVADAKSLDDKKRAALEKSLNRAAARTEYHCELASSTGPAVIPMTPVYGNGYGSEVEYYGLDVSFNGHKRTLQIDTGASGLLLTQSAGGAAGLQSVTKIHVGGFGSQGPNDANLEYSPSVRIGGLEFKNCVVEVLANYGALGGSHIEGNKMDDSEGLIGSDIFSRYLVTLDYVRHELRLDPLPQIPDHVPASLDPLGGSNDYATLPVDRYIAPSMKSWTSIYRRGHDLLVPTSINGKRAGVFLADTGSFTDLIDVGRAKSVTKTGESSTMVLGLSGVESLSEAGGFTADFAGIRLPVKSMDAMDLSKFGDGVKGFLGYPTLHQLIMHLDYRDNLVLFEAPNGKKL